MRAIQGASERRTTDEEERNWEVGLAQEEWVRLGVPLKPGQGARNKTKDNRAHVRWKTIISTPIQVRSTSFLPNNLAHNLNSAVSFADFDFRLPSSPNSAPVRPFAIADAIARVCVRRMSRASTCISSISIYAWNVPPKAKRRKRPIRNAHGFGGKDGYQSSRKRE